MNLYSIKHEYFIPCIFALLSQKKPDLKSQCIRYPGRNYVTYTKNLAMQAHILISA
jgi:hypothetical protein